MDLSIFAERLNDLLEDNSVEIEEFAKAVGCSRATAYGLRKGNRVPSAQLLARIADYFHCSTDYLAGLDDNLFFSKNFKTCPPFEKQLPVICKRYGYSRYRLQKVTGIGETCLQYWAKGITSPSVDNLVKMAKALDCTLDFLIGRI